MPRRIARVSKCRRLRGSGGGDQAMKRPRGLRWRRWWPLALEMRALHRRRTFDQHRLVYGPDFKTGARRVMIHG